MFLLGRIIWFVMMLVLKFIFGLYLKSLISFFNICFLCIVILNFLGLFSIVFIGNVCVKVILFKLFFYVGCIFVLFR